MNDEVENLLDTETTDETLEDEAVENTESSEGEETAEEMKTETQEATPDPRDQEIARLKKQVDDVNGKYGGERSTRALMQKMAKVIEDDGLLDRAEVAQKMGIDRKRVDGLLDNMPDDQDAFQKKAMTAATQFAALKPAIKAMGKDPDQLETIFSTALQFDQKEREAFMDVDDEQITAHILQRAGELEERMKPLIEAKGSPIAALEAAQRRIAELEGKLAATGTKQTEEASEDASTDERAEIVQPREKRVIGANGVASKGNASDPYARLFGV